MPLRRKAPASISPLSGYTSGTILTIDGGLSSRDTL